MKHSFEEKLNIVSQALNGVPQRETIKSIFHEHKGRYGYRRVTAEMHNHEVVINHKTVQHLMDEMGVKSKIREIRYHSYKGGVGGIAPNVINRDFSAETHNRKWAADITQINIGAVNFYLSPILDMFNGEIISYNNPKVQSWSRCTTCLTRLLLNLIALMT